MLEWSKIMQTPEYLEATRITLLQEDMSPLAVKWCGISQGDRVLDVGCGTGCFLRYLSGGTQGVSYTGLEIDKGFLAAAGGVMGENSVSYVEGSAYEMPFADGSFDCVVSHTFFNCADRSEAAIQEMLRVCRSGGRISTVSSLSLGYETWNLGYYPEECGWAKGIPRFQEQMARVLRKLGLGLSDYNRGRPASALPRFFHEAGLRQIALHSLPRTFSLSDAGLSPQIKERYVELLYEGEDRRIRNIMELTDFLSYVTAEECGAYRKALKERRDFWLAHLDDNEIWDWVGGSSLLVTGVRPEK